MRRMAAWTLAGTLALGAIPGPAQVAEAAAFIGPRLTVVVGSPIRVRRGHGELHVDVDPERARVYLDGRYVGRGDTTRVLRSGRHTVRVVLADGRDAAQTVRVDAGRRTTVRLDLD